jgi:putative methionine-R-sulfoxide reductase with GAF domain
VTDGRVPAAATPAADARSADRPWARIVSEVAVAAEASGGHLEAEALVDLLWSHLAPTGVSWLGIYLVDPAASEATRLVLGPRRDRPACSPIGLHGVCGRCVRQRRPILVEDVSTLGPDYIACDPRDRSEIVLPLLDGAICWGVLDLDSHAPGAFGPADEQGLLAVLEAAALRPAGHA